MTWDITTPTGSDNISNGDNIIREFKTDIQTALKANDATLGDEGVFPVSTSSPKYRYRGLKGTTAQRPTPGNYGLYYNTTTSQLERDNGSAWEVVGTPIPSGTKMLFYADTAPSGWTIDTTLNSRVIVLTRGSGAGGRTGGTTSAAANDTATGSLSTVSISSSVTPTYGSSITTDPGASNRLCPYTTAGGISTVSNLGSGVTSTINASYLPISANFIMCTKD